MSVLYLVYYFSRPLRSQPSSPTHPNWTARLFNAVPGGDGLYLGGLHVDLDGLGDFKSEKFEKHSKWRGKTLEEAFPEGRRDAL